MVNSTLRLKKLGINTHKEAVVYIREDAQICKSQDTDVQTRILVTLGDKKIIATLNTIQSTLLKKDEASLSSMAWDYLNAKSGDKIELSYPPPIHSLQYVQSKLQGEQLSKEQLNAIIHDIFHGVYPDVDIAMFLAACAGNRLSESEVLHLTHAMIETGEQLSWPAAIVTDKHSIDGLPANRTSLIVVPIIAAFGLTIPKTSSRAIITPAGTADTMEVFCPVNLDVQRMREVVERENGCIVWDGAVTLCPVDNILTHVERAMSLDSEGQIVASILGKKIAAGATHIIIDIPIGLTAKITTKEKADVLKNYLFNISKQLQIQLKIMYTKADEPISSGIGPALEAKDVLAVLSNHNDAPRDLKEKALELAGHMIEFSPNVAPGTGREIATNILSSGQALHKFQAICEAQGGFKLPRQAPYKHTITASFAGKILDMDNRKICRLAQLAGAPHCKTSGVEMCVKIGNFVDHDQPLFVIHAESKAELEYALSYLQQCYDMINIQES